MSSFAPTFEITSRIAAGLMRIDRARGFLDAARLSDEWTEKMRDRALVLEAHHTTHIEGTHLTLEESERLLGGGVVPSADPDDVRELLNYRAALEFISDHLDSGGPITEELIKGIHHQLVEGVRGGSAGPGEYRTIQNYIVNSRTREVIYTPPPASEVPRMMADLVSWLQTERDTHPVIVGGLAQFQLVHVHPFVDGNGRTARLLSTLCLYRFGYDFKRLFSISKYYDQDRPAYYSAIQSVREHDMEMTGWLEYFVDGLATQMLEVQERGTMAIRRDVLLLRARRLGLKDRAVDVLAFLLDRGRGTVSECEEALGENRRTLQRDLKALVEQGFIREVGSGSTDPTKYYEPAPDEL
ncbi:Fic family protein [bacterium]|nr:Fic family protein [bacterium]